MFFLLLFLLVSPVAIWVFFILAATVAIHFLPLILVALAGWVIYKIARRRSTRG